MFGSSPTLTPQTQAVYDYVSSRRDGAAYLLAVPSWTQASRFILATGQEALPLGGFSGTVPTPTLARVQDLIRGGAAAVLLVRLVRRTGDRRRGPPIGHGRPDRFLGARRV